MNRYRVILYAQAAPVLCSKQAVYADNKLDAAQMIAGQPLVEVGSLHKRSLKSLVAKVWEAESIKPDPRYFLSA